MYFRVCGFARKMQILQDHKNTGHGIDEGTTTMPEVTKNKKQKPVSLEEMRGGRK